MPKISIIIPLLNEQKYIVNSLESILKSDYEMSDMELILVDGGSVDKTLDIVDEYLKKYSFIKLLHNPKKIVPIAMNIGIKASTGEYIFRLDAHTTYPTNYLSTLIAWHQKLDAQNVGTPIETKVKNINAKSNAIAKVLSNKFGVGNSEFRVGVNKLSEVETVPFGCFKKSTFEKYGVYDERLERNQDIELNKRIVKGGGKIYLLPDIFCSYYARETFGALAKNNFSNGKWNILTAYYTKEFSSLNLRHFVPLLYILSLLLPSILSLAESGFFYIALLSFTSHFILISSVSWRLRDETTTFYHLLLAFYTLHISYGVGSLFGIFSLFLSSFRRD